MQKITYTEEEIRRLSRSLIGKTFGDINKYKQTSYTKGMFGHIVEQDAFGYDINSRAEPDFLEAGIELKVTPYKVNMNGSLSAKERLVLNIINFNEEVKYNFFTSSFWRKNRKMQILWYKYEEGKRREDFKITHELLFEIPEEDMETVINDWEIIVGKIRDGKAHEISESDTKILGACTKGANSSSLREQPYSKELAMQRAFCLKQPYMTKLVRKVIGGE